MNINLANRYDLSMKFVSYHTRNLEFEVRKAILGEGLCATPSSISWVDIESRTVFWDERQYDLRDCVPSVIFKEISGTLLLGTDQGIQILHKSGRLEMAVQLEGHDPAEFRLNDGCALGDQEFLVGAMSKKEPEQKLGAIYKFDLSGRSEKLDWDCYIPNGFVNLGSGNVLICDSKKHEIYKLNLSDEKHLVDVWYSTAGPETPDGGCILSDGQIAFAMWDGGKIQLFDINGNPTKSISVPAKRPTNCKFCVKRNRLLVTTATFGLDKNELEQYPLSGHLIALEIF